MSTLLDGTVRKQGDRVRIVAELVNAAMHSALDANVRSRTERYFRGTGGIARAVAQSLKVTSLGSR